MIQLRDYQKGCSNAVVNHMLDGNDGALGVLATGCHEKAHPILMFDGSVKPIEDVVIGDSVMGPDSSQRNVIRLARGREMMYRVVPAKGESFVVNENHIMSLITTKCCGKRKRAHTGNEIVNISIKDYLDKGVTFKHVHKLRRCAVKFNNQAHLPMDPWFLGVLLGDGGMTTNAVCLTTMDREIEEMAYLFASLYGTTIRRTQKIGNKASQLYFVGNGKMGGNRVTSIIRSLGLLKKRCDYKFIPAIYKTSSLTDRLKIIAGILDADGHLCSSGTFDYISKSKQLSDDVVFMCRSVGLAAYVSECQKSSQTGYTGTYFRVSISGDVNKIPCVLPRKMAGPRKQIKRVNVTGFKVEKVGIGDFYGFAIDGDHLYLDGNFVAHHNTGKAYTLCDIIKQCDSYYPGTRVLQLTHTQELIRQNYSSMLKYWPSAPCGVNSAGLGSRDYRSQIIFGGVQSLYNKANQIGEVHIAIVDEAQLIPRNKSTMYGQLINDLKAMNPNMKLAGLTATPFRTQCGMLHEGEDALFSEIVYDYGIGKAIADGYLVSPRTKNTDLKLDVTGVAKRGGEFVAGQLEQAVDIDETTRAVVSETIAYAKQNGLKKWLVFGAGEQHCTHIVEELRRQGVSAETVTGKTPKGKRDATFNAFKKGIITAIVNINIAAVGFDDPEVDLIVSVRPTGAAGLWVQIVGRGSRLIDWRIGQLPTAPERLAAIASSDKPVFHVLDFAGNTERHGPIDMIMAHDTRTKGDGGDAPTKTCPECAEIVYAGTKICPCCEYEFPDSGPEIASTASTEVLLSSQREPVWKNVTHVEYSRHKSRANRFSVKVTYWSGIGQYYHEWLSPKSPKANNWWFQRLPGTPIPQTIEEFIERANDLPKPERIKIFKNGKYWEILGYEIE